MNEGVKRILHERAKALASGAKKEEMKQEGIEVVEFLLAQEKYGVETSFVREVYPLKELAWLPGAPAFVLGAINVRGKIYSVVDLRKFFGLPEKGLTDLSRVILLQGEGMEVGVLADQILEVRLIPFAEIQRTLPTLTGERAAYLRGVTAMGRVILDAKKFLSDKNLAAQEESAA